MIKKQYIVRSILLTKYLFLGILLKYTSITQSANLKKVLQGKKCGSYEEIIAETDAYVERKDKLFYKKGIEKLEKRWNKCITFNE